MGIVFDSCCDTDNNPCLCRSKGLTEIGLAELGYSDTVVFRPAMLGEGDRPDSRPLEAFVVYVFTAAFSELLFIHGTEQLSRQSYIQDIVHRLHAGMSRF